MKKLLLKPRVDVLTEGETKALGQGLTTKAFYSLQLEEG